jgi:hypothetical protein
MSKTRDTGYLANVIQVHDTGVRIMSGSTMLMAVSSSGAVTITGEMSGSDAANALLLSGTGSVGFTTTSSFLAVSSSQQQISSSLLQVSASYISLSGSYNTFSGSNSTILTAVSSSQQQISASLLNVIAIGATTGSNSFRANQSITGSLVVSSTITAQTLVVQTVTSSIVYSSGSNIFGSDLNSRQTFTGSMNVTGSGTFSGNITAGSTVQVKGYAAPSNGAGLELFYLNGEGRLFAYDRDCASYKSMGLGVGGTQLYLTGSGAVGIGTSNPSAYGTQRFLAVGNGAASQVARFTDGANGDLVFDNPSAGITRITAQYGTDGTLVFAKGTGFAETMRIASSGNVGMGTQSPSHKLVVGEDLGDFGSGYNALVVGCSTKRNGIFLGQSATNNTHLIWVCNATTANAYAQLTTYNYCNALYIDASKVILQNNNITGRVGIGTDTPTSKLVVQDSNPANCFCSIAVFGNSTPAPRIHIKDEDGTLENPAGIYSDTGYGTGIYNLGTGINSGVKIFTGTPIARRLWINCVGIATFSCQVCALGLNLTGASDAVLNISAPNSTAYITFKNACNSLWGIGSSFIGRNCNLDVYNFSTNTNALTIDKTGVTCFASTVCTGGLVYAASGGCFKSAADARALFLKQNTVNSDNIIQFIDHNGTYAWEVVGRNSVFYIYNAAVSNFSMCINPSTNAVHFPGAVSKGSGTFNIEHPLESKKCTHRLVHSFIEGPQADLIYRGKINLENGIACVNVDCAARMSEGTFEALNRCAQVFTTNESSWDAIRGKLYGNVLVIESENTESQDEISWMVIGERQDKHIKETSITDAFGRIIVEPEVEEQFTCICV